MGPSTRAQGYPQAAQGRAQGQLSRAQDCTATAQWKGPAFCRALSPEWTLLSAACIHPEILQAIFCRLFPAEQDLFIPRLALTSTCDQVAQGDLIFVLPPSMREYRIRRDIVDKIFGKAEFARVLGLLYEPHE